MITTLLFDLDGTLLPLDENEFIRLYFSEMQHFFDQRGQNGKIIAQSVMACTQAMLTNDGSQTNEQAFWAAFHKRLPDRNQSIIFEFEQFYETRFDVVKASSWVHSSANNILSSLKSKGYQLVLATNPIFPKVATLKRIQWANLQATDFECITTYETDSFTKPSLDYYRQILKRLNKTPEECMMIGNDVDEDMIASNLGMKTYLITDCIINRQNQSLDNFPHSDFKAFSQWIEDLPFLK